MAVAATVVAVASTVVAVAATVFIFCDLHTGRPRSIPPEVLAAYPLVSGDDEP